MKENPITALDPELREALAAAAKILLAALCFIAAFLIYAVL